MDNNDERDYAEEEYNRRTMQDPDFDDDGFFSDEIATNMYGSDNLDNLPQWDGENMSVFPDNSSLPVGYGDEWDGSSRNQSNHFFIGHSGHVTILWHVTNNPYERYDSSISYHVPALDGSALYVWCDLKFTDHQALLHIEGVTENLCAMGDSSHLRTMTKLISE